MNPLSLELSPTPISRRGGSRRVKGRIPSWVLSLIIAGNFVASAPIFGAPIIISWEGTVSSIPIIGTSNPPSGLAVGTPISGNVVFDLAQSSSSGLIYASYEHGTRHRFGDPLFQSITAAGHHWKTYGGSLNLIETINGDMKTVNVFSTSEYDRATSFPDYAGTFEAGFAISDELKPLDLFRGESPNITFNVSQMTYGNGFLTTRHWDGNDTLVAGYYINFVINKVSQGAYSEPTQHFHVKAKASPSRKGRVYGSRRFVSGERVNVRAVPKRGIKFLYWTENGKRLSRKRSLSFTSNRSRYLIAHFR